MKLATLVMIGVGLASPAVAQRGESVPPPSSIAALEGDWTRNEEVSEDPIQKTANLWRDPDRTSAVLTGLSASLAERLGRLRLHVVDDRIRLRNARQEALEFPADGSIVTDQYGNRHRANILPGALEIETARPGWLLIETLFRQAEELHRVIEIQSESFPNLRFLTVYEKDGDAPPAANPADDDASRFVRPAAIRIVPPRGGHRQLLEGRVEVETLIVDPSIGSVDFFLDGRRVRRARGLPFSARIDLAAPPREQTLEVRAYSVRGAFVGGDRLVLNRIDPPFGIRIGAVTPSEADGDSVEVEARVAVPRGAFLERVDFYRNEDLAWTVDDLSRYGAAGGFRTVRGNLETPDLSPNDYVRVTARLADGRELEDAQLVEGVTFKGEIDVQLIHLQVLVVDAGGAPVDGMAAADFRILEDGQWRTVEDVRQAGDVPLILGMAIDSSASMRPIWSQLRSVVGTFLDSSLAGDDRAFLVDFDESIRLLQHPTSNLRALRTSMDRLVSNGGTALNDGILFSLVLYEDEPGRRALVVVTDGVDIDSRSEPGQAAAFAERVGIPLYLIDLGRDRIALPNGNGADGGSAGAQLIRTARSADHVLRMRQQARQSGGRLFRIDPELPAPVFVSRVEEVFGQIREDLRRQQVLTYYTGRPVGSAIDPEVQVVREGLTVKSVLPLDRVEASVEPTPILPTPPTESQDATGYTYTATDTEDDATVPSSIEADSIIVEEAPADEAPIVPAPDRQPPPTAGEREQRRTDDRVSVPVSVEVPSFGGATIADQAWVQFEGLAPLTFPAATGGEGRLNYGLAPSPPAGLSFDLATRVLWGSPATPQSATEYTYTATDASGAAATISFSITVKAAARDDAAVVSVLGLPARMAAGRTATVLVRVTNTGTTTWTPFGGYGLGSESPENNDTWGVRRAPLSGSVAPNETATFEFPITAPDQAGSYTFAWRMVRDPGGWFGSSTGDVAIAVEVP